LHLLLSTKGKRLFVSYTINKKSVLTFETFLFQFIHGHAYVGDVITTAFSLKSRNRIIGLLASKHITYVPNDTFIAEGRNNAKIVRALARKNKIKAPITDFVDSVLAGTKPVVAFNSLWKKIKKETKLKD